MTGRMWLCFILLLVAKSTLGDTESPKEQVNINTDTQKSVHGHVLTKDPEYPKMFTKSKEIAPMAETIDKLGKHQPGKGAGDGKGLMTTIKTNTNFHVVTYDRKENVPVPDPVHGKGHMTTVKDSIVDKLTPEPKGNVAIQDHGHHKNYKKTTKLVPKIHKQTPGYKGITPVPAFGHTNSLGKMTPRHKKRPEKSFITGPCSATCGIGFQDVYRIKGCPDNEPRCRVAVQECRVTPDCGWGKVVYKTEDTVLLDCSFKSNTQQYTYVWRQLAKDKEPQVLAYDNSVLEVSRKEDDIFYECNTIEGTSLIANVKFKVASKSDRQTEKWDYTNLSYLLMYGVIGIFDLAAIIVIVRTLYPYICCKKKEDIENKGEVEIIEIK